MIDVHCLNIQLSLFLTPALLHYNSSSPPASEKKTDSEDPRRYKLLEWLPYQEAIMVAQLWFGMCNIRPRLPSCHRQEVLRQLRG